MDETGNYYYVVIPESDAVITAADIIKTATDQLAGASDEDKLGAAGGKLLIAAATGMGKVTAEMLKTAGAGTTVKYAEITIDVTGLARNTSYRICVAATDEPLIDLDADVQAGEQGNAETLTVNCSDAKALAFNTAKSDLTGATVTLGGETGFVYDGTVQTPSAVTVKLADGTVVAPQQYDVSYDNDKTTEPAREQIYAGTIQVTVTAKEDGDFTGEAGNCPSYTIAPKPVQAVLHTEDKAYDGTTTARVTGTVDTGVTGEKLAITGLTGAFVDAKAGTDKPVTVDTTQAVITPEGETSAANYTLTYAGEQLKADITRLPAPQLTWPKAANITEGQKLSESALTGGSTEYGSFAWADGSQPHRRADMNLMSCSPPKRKYRTITRK